MVRALTPDNSAISATVASKPRRATTVMAASLIRERVSSCCSSAKERGVGCGSFTVVFPGPSVDRRLGVLGVEDASGHRIPFLIGPHYGPVDRPRRKEGSHRREGRLYESCPFNSYASTLDNRAPSQAASGSSVPGAESSS